MYEAVGPRSSGPDRIGHLACALVSNATAQTSPTATAGPPAGGNRLQRPPQLATTTQKGLITVTWFNVQVQLDLPAARLDDDLTDALLQELEGFHTSLSSHDGLITARLSLQAENLPQAARIAIAVTEQAASAAGTPASTAAVTAMTEEEFATREGWPEVPASLLQTQDPAQAGLSLKEAAQLLGITRQAVTRRLLLPAEHPDHLRGFRDDTRRWHVEASDVRRAVHRREQSLNAGLTDQEDARDPDQTGSSASADPTGEQETLGDAAASNATSTSSTSSGTTTSSTTRPRRRAAKVVP